MAKHIIVTAGGTGGHTFPAEATAEALIQKGYRVTLVTDRRYFDYRTPPKGLEVETVSSASPAGGVIKKFKAVFAIARGIFQALWIFAKIRPHMVIGFGGYPSFPMVLVAGFKSVPLIIQEQNSFLGKVNRFGAKNAQAVAVAYDQVKGIPEGIKVIKTGNPIRQAFIDLRNAQPYKLPKKNQSFTILITGGSQGASIFSDVVPKAIKRLCDKGVNLHVVQQCRSGEIEAVAAFYKKHKISAEVVSFIEDMPHQMRNAHVMVARAGASTISEITALGVPAIFVPLPSAADDHQTQNAQALVNAQAGMVIKQGQFTQNSLFQVLDALIESPDKLTQMAQNTLQLGLPNATNSLVALVEDVLKRKL
jgi:UDP-N-acetylglucosamine--N-acetylmuramyl-(pentapeptide) pyrophosphoryl-undecaprenol N-acetylglucosamine transferase